MSELVNANIPGNVAVMGEPERWWSWSRFRLVPLWDFRRADKWNPSRFHFDWLGLGVWSKGCPDISVSATLDDLGLRLRIEPPYLHVQWTIPLFPWRWHQKLWRKPPGMRGKP